MCCMDKALAQWLITSRYGWTYCTIGWWAGHRTDLTTALENNIQMFNASDFPNIYMLSHVELKQTASTHRQPFIHLKYLTTWQLDSPKLPTTQHMWQQEDISDDFTSGSASLCESPTTNTRFRWTTLTLAKCLRFSVTFCFFSFCFCFFSFFILWISSCDRGL